tara:strand:+ start:7404 stop:9764 length:2361 start_codon:yes stop_codon:yes gene_type:complete
MATNTEKIVVQVVVQGDKQLDKLNKKTKGVTVGFTKMVTGVFAAIAAFRQINRVASDMIKTFTKFEFEMAKVKAITGSTEKDFKKLSATAQQLGRTTFFTAAQVAELQVNFGKLGFSTQEILDAQEATLLLATATQSDLGRAAIVAGAAVRGFSLDASETARVVDVMAKAFTSSALDIEKFQTSMTKVSPIAAAANISLEATTAVMGTLTDAGIEASIAGTSLRNIFLKMADPTSDLSKHLGFTVNSSEDLEKALVKLNSESLTNAEMMQLVDLRQVAAFATMVNGVENIQELTDAFDNANGSAKEMADIMADTLQGDILKAKSAWQGFIIAVMEGGNNINETLRTIIGGFALLVNRFTDDMKTAEQRSVDIFQEQQNIAKTQKKELKEIHDIETELVDQLQFRINELTKENEQRQKFAFANEEQEQKRQREVAATELAIKLLREEIERLNKVEGERLKLQEIEEAIRKEKERRAKAAEAERLAKEEEAAEQKAFQEKKQQLEINLTEQLNILKQQLINEQITQDEFDALAFEKEQAHLANMLGLYTHYGKETADINAAILDSELKRILEIDNAEKKSAKQQIDNMESIGKQLIMVGEQEEELIGLKRLGIKISQAAAVAKSAEAAVDAVRAVTSAAADSPWYLKVINVLAVLAAVTSGVANARALMSDTFADGGMVHGRSHAQGGEKFAVGGRVVELEGGEAVINKRSTAMFRNQLSAMNVAGGGVKFADGGLMNMPSFAQSQFNATSQAGMMGAIGQGSKVVVVESDISQVQNTVSVIEAEATF